MKLSTLPPKQFHPQLFAPVRSIRSDDGDVFESRLSLPPEAPRPELSACSDARAGDRVDPPLDTPPGVDAPILDGWTDSAALMWTLIVLGGVFGVCAAIAGMTGGGR